MAYKIVNDDSLTDVANAIRVQGGFSATLEFPDGFVSAIQNLSPSPTLQTKSVAFTPATTIQTSSVTADAGYDGLSEVDVTVNAVPEAEFDASVGLTFYTEGGVTKCEVSGGGYAETAGWIDEGAVLTREVHPAIPSGATYTPSTSAQTIGGRGHVFEGTATIDPIPSQYIVPSSTYSITSNGIYDIVSFASVDVNVSGGGGGSEQEDKIIDGSIVSVFNDRASSLRAYAFYSQQNLTTASFPNALSIGSCAFSYCSKLTSISFPKVVTIGASAFRSCYSLTAANFPSVTTISVSAFQTCSNMETFSAPLLSTVSAYAFADCSKLKNVYMPTVHSMMSNAFLRCIALQTISFNYLSSVASSAFYGCSKLMSLYLLRSSVTTLANVNALSQTPMSLSTYTGSFGSIYVPASLVDSYKSATNWSAYSARITSYVE